RQGCELTSHQNRIGVEEDEHGKSKKKIFRSPKETLESQEPMKFI
ncbi:20402_t:CDS:1, partial [Gigaspora rosea]